MFISWLGTNALFHNSLLDFDSEYPVDSHCSIFSYIRDRGTTVTMIVLSLLMFTLVGVLARYDPNSKNNIAVYWGQNSKGDQRGGSGAQKPLLAYCESEPCLPWGTIYFFYATITNGTSGSDVDVGVQQS